MIGLSLATVRVISHKGYLAYRWARPIHSYSQQPRPSPRTPASRLNDITYTVCSAITLAKFQKPGCFRAYHPIYQVSSSRLLLSFRSSVPPRHSVKLACLRLPQMCLVHISLSSRLPLGSVYLHLIGFAFVRRCYHCSFYHHIRFAASRRCVSILA